MASAGTTPQRANPGPQVYSTLPPRGWWKGRKRLVAGSVTRLVSVLCDAWWPTGIGWLGKKVLDWNRPPYQSDSFIFV